MTTHPHRSRYLVAAAITAALLLLGGCGAALNMLTDTGNSGAADDLSYQCDSQMGPDPSASTTPQPPRETATATPASQPPETYPQRNPYASIDPSDATGLPPRIEQCLSIMASAPYQQPALSTRTATTGGDRAALLARQLIDGHITTAPGAGDITGPTGTAISPANFVRSVLYTASDHTLVVPADLSGQIIYGQRVDPAAITAGDLIFGGFHNGHPSTVAIAITPTLAAYAPPDSHLIALTPIPLTGNIIVKRVWTGRQQ